MFRLLKPQMAQHSEGYIVQTKDRHTIQYVEKGWVADIGAEFGPVSELFGRTLKTWIRDGRQEEISEARKVEILKRAAEGLAMIMRGPVDIKWPPPSGHEPSL